MDRESHRLMNAFFFSLVETMLAMKAVMVMTIAMAVRLAGWCWYFLILSEKGLLSNTPAFASVFFMILILAA